MVGNTFHLNYIVMKWDKNKTKDMDQLILNIFKDKK